MSGASETVTEDNTTAAILWGDMKGARQCFTPVVWKLNLLLQNYPLPSKLGDWRIKIPILISNLGNVLF
jgi:hypothetical protein